MRASKQAMAGLAVVLFSAGAAHAEWKLVLGTPTGTGAFDAKAVTAVVRKHLDQLRHCYGATATAIATFTIGADGRVSDASVTGLNEDNHACIVAVLTGLAFAKPSDGKPVRVRYPLQYDTPIQRTAIEDPHVFELLGWKPASGSIVKLTVKSGVGEADVRRTIQRDLSSGSSSRLADCFERWRGKPALPGTATCELAIRANGSVSSATVKGLAKPEANACVADVLKSLRFPGTARGEVAVSLQLAFQPARLPESGFTAPP